MASPTSRPDYSSHGKTVVSPENYAFLQHEIYRDSGIVLDETKVYLMEARLGPVLIEQGLQTIDDLCALLRKTSSGIVRQRVVEAMTTNETLFFRDTAAFDALQAFVIPELAEKRSAMKMLSVWSAASSSGQEAYSVAMILAEMGLPGWDIRVLGTDLNHQMLERARAGRYLQIEVNRGLPARYQLKHFTKDGRVWQISDAIRSMVEFVPFDLRKSAAALGQFDLILCRNVLIYFDLETKKKILAGMRQVLRPGGVLLLGCAESTFNLSSEFAAVSLGKANFYRAI